MDNQNTTDKARLLQLLSGISNHILSVATTRSTTRLAHGYSVSRDELKRLPSAVPINDIAEAVGLLDKLGYVEEAEWLHKACRQFSSEDPRIEITYQQFADKFNEMLGCIQKKVSQAEPANDPADSAGAIDINLTAEDDWLPDYQRATFQQMSEITGIKVETLQSKWGGAEYLDMPIVKYWKNDIYWLNEWVNANLNPNKPDNIGNY